MNIPLFDPYLDKAGERIKAAAQEAHSLGLVDDKGNLLSSELPPDMREGSEHDFGG
ncbi:MAG: hypothetical protein U0R19_20455 [Bryobacteraceae bacterium]